MEYDVLIELSLMVTLLYYWVEWSAGRFPLGSITLNTFLVCFSVDRIFDWEPVASWPKPIANEWPGPIYKYILRIWQELRKDVRNELELGLWDQLMSQLFIARERTSIYKLPPSWKFEDRPPEVRKTTGLVIHFLPTSYSTAVQQSHRISSYIRIHSVFRASHPGPS